MLRFIFVCVLVSVVQASFLDKLLTANRKAEIVQMPKEEQTELQNPSEQQKDSEETGKDGEPENLDNQSMALALRDGDSDGNGDGPEQTDENGVVIRAKRCCYGYGCGCCCGCVTMAATATMAPCGCCGCCG